jgi:molybdenum cofactor synthesis domain-containing protein
MGRVEAICISVTKGEKKSPQPMAHFVAHNGIEGDAHAGCWHRQVSLLRAEDIEAMRLRALRGLKYGDFAENLVVSGVDLGALGLGSRLRIAGETVLTVTQLGKACHQRCVIYHEAGDCIMPRLGVFARVLRGGVVTVGDAVEVLEIVPREQYQIVILTISDRCSRGEAPDAAGPAVRRLLESCLQAHTYATEVLPDDCDQIAARLRHYSAGHSIDLVLAVGGTGFAPRDVTPEAVTAVIQRPTPGLDEAMRRASLDKTPMAMLSRAVSGIRHSTLIIALPGSARAAAENLEAVLPALGHGLAKLRGDLSDCDSARARSTA